MTVGRSSGVLCLAQIVPAPTMLSSISVVRGATGFPDMTRTQIIDEELNAVATHLRARREAILEAWRASADADPQLTTANALPRSQFNDHIPDVLDLLERKLQAWPQEPQRLDEERKRDAAAHGLQRWHQGYRLREVTREWGHLQLALLDEIEQLCERAPAQLDRSDGDCAAGAERVVRRRASARACPSTFSWSSSKRKATCATWRGR